MNPEPYRGRPTDSHKPKKAKKAKRKILGSGSAPRSVTAFAVALFLVLPAALAGCFVAYAVMAP